MLAHIESCSLHNNGVGSSAMGSALTLIAADVTNHSHTISNVNFFDNGYAFEHGLYSTASFPIIALYSLSVDIINCSFVSNCGNALFIADSSVHFSGNNYFGGNTGNKGAAMYLDQGSKIHLLHTLVTFEENHANFTGGAIYIATAEYFKPTCPFAYPVSSTLNFLNNTAVFAGDAVYGGQLDQIIVTDNKRCITILKRHSHFEQPNNLSLISSQQSRVCLCKDIIPDCLNIFSTKRVYPGEEFNLSVVAVGQNFGTTTGFVYAQLLQEREGTSLGQLQHFQLVHQYQCNHPSYTIYSRHEKEILVLTATVTVIQVYGDNTTVQASISEYNRYNRSYIPKDLLQFPVYINVTLRRCPPGFKLTDSPPYKCECSNRLQRLQGKYKVTCLINTQQVERSGTVWIGFDNKTNNGSEVDVIYSK